MSYDFESFKTDMITKRENINDGFTLKCNICGNEIKFNKEMPVKDYSFNNITAFSYLEDERCEIECKCGNKAFID
jgi:hypothetical protein